MLAYAGPGLSRKNYSFGLEPSVFSAPLERATPSSDDFRRPRGVSDMPGDVPDPASWVAGATKSELERLLKNALLAMGRYGQSAKGDMCNVTT